MLKAALKDKKLTFVASTSEVYGKATKFPFSEDDDLTIGGDEKPALVPMPLPSNSMNS